MSSVIHERVERVLGFISDMLRGLQPNQEPISSEVLIARFAELLEADKTQLQAQGLVSPDLMIARRYALTTSAQLLLWLIVASWLEPELRDLISRANDNILRYRVDPSLCLRIFDQDRRGKAEVLALLSTPSPLIDGALVRQKVYGQTHNWLFHELCPSPQLVLFFSGARRLSLGCSRVASLCDPALKLNDLPLGGTLTSLLTLAQRFYKEERPWVFSQQSRGLHYPNSVVLSIIGSLGRGRATAALGIAGSLERQAIELDAEHLNVESLSKATELIEEIVLTCELLEVPLIIKSAAKLVDLEARLSKVFARRLQRHHILVFLCLGKSDQVAPEIDSLTLRKCSLNPAPPELLAEQWRTHLSAPEFEFSGVDLRALAQRLQLTPLQIRKASALARLSGNGPTTAPIALDNALMEAIVKEQVPKSIGRLATVSEPKLSIHDLIVSSEIEQNIREIISAAHHRRRVLEEWGVGIRIQRGTGIIALFDGEPGTGKTHASEVIASELGLNLVQINIAAIVDKYIGETEKNLTEIFARARPDTSLLLFDEADSLFSKRTASVSKSTDRYSNMNINVLLQLVERYKGISLLTTNLKRAIDPAFERRFTFKIHFPMPREQERLRIWRYLLHEGVTVGETIDYEWLSEVELSGGEIKNAILLAAYSAAHAGEHINNDHLYAAAQREAAAAGRMVRHPGGGPM